MKKEYFSPEFDILKFKLNNIMADKIQHSISEDFGEGGEEGPGE